MDELTSEQEDLILEAGRKCVCEMCNESFSEEDLDFVSIEGGDSLLVCRSCEEVMKND